MDTQIIFQSPPDYYFLNLFSKIKEREGTNLSFGIYPIIFYPKLLDTLLILPLVIKYIRFRINKNNWKKRYLSLGIKFYKINRYNYFSCFVKSIVKYKSIRTNEDILSLKANNIHIGDLVYDTYLRYYNKPTLDKKNFGIFVIIFRSYQLLQLLNEINKYKIVNKYFSSYCTYISHGLPVRFFLKNKSKVFSSGNIYEIIKRHDFDDPYQTRNLKFDHNLKNKNIEIGLKKIEKRIHGIEKLAFMKTSTFNDENEFKHDDLIGVVFLHDLFDSPHIYGNMIFNDFYEWTIYTLNLIEKNNLKIGVKPHPNQINESKVIIEKLKKKYNKLCWIDEITSNKSILQSNIKFGISVYGSIIGELAYFGKFSISCGKNPYNNFSFLVNSRDILEYSNNIIRAINSDKKTNYKTEVGNFYYELYKNNSNFYNIPDEIIHNKFNESKQKFFYDRL